VRACLITAHLHLYRLTGNGSAVEGKGLGPLGQCSGMAGLLRGTKQDWDWLVWGWDDQGEMMRDGRRRGEEWRVVLCCGVLWRRWGDGGVRQREAMGTLRAGRAERC